MCVIWDRSDERYKLQGKATPIRARTEPLGSWTMTFPEFLEKTSCQPFAAAAFIPEKEFILQGG